MARPGYMKITGEDQGELTGSVDDERYGEGLIKVFSLTHKVARSGESEGGVLNAAVTHQPVELVKPVDQASPLLNQALCEQEFLQVLITWYQPDSEGQQVPFYQMELEKAQILSLTTEMPDCNQPSQDGWHYLERLRLVYKSIAWRMGPGGEQEFMTQVRKAGE
ncbi:type VI secretion system tube protein TssD [Marinospirillum sp.]|uniref:type VI secretion system tube protein TssD n=1 Tax=Marinospirillum sp. TaxID=2183934 RepID=UPI00286FE728|nr:type VI secretion system tube protein TssD [Marinospirillum sp.]MDR9467442.1 type VI secretion system tube protein TssD [Marinospirillum sp.]